MTQENKVVCNIASWGVFLLKNVDSSCTLFTKYCRKKERDSEHFLFFSYMQRNVQSWRTTSTFYLQIQGFRTYILQKEVHFENICFKLCDHEAQVLSVQMRTPGQVRWHQTGRMLELLWTRERCLKPLQHFYYS